MNENEELKDKVQGLEIAIDNLPEKDKGFAKSLIDSSKRNGSLSPKQVYWVQVLLDRALGKEKVPEVAQVGNFAGVYALFTKAKQKLKYPKIFLAVGNTPIVLSIAGQKSKVPNVINVAGEGDFYQRAWYGRVLEDGSWQKGKSALTDAEKVEELLKSLSRNPSKTAKEYGKLTGRCCFCSKVLSDEKSTAAGYGPICAEHFGLKNEWKAAQPVLAAA